MDLQHPIASVIPSAHGAILAVLATTERQLTGRTLAALTNGQVSSTQTKSVLRDLVAAGIVTCESHPPANLYQLNRNHVASEAIVMLATLAERLRNRMGKAVAGWAILPTAVWLFGSGARQDGRLDSDLDVLVIRPARVSDDDPDWHQQTFQLAADTTSWSGNDCRIIELSDTELADWSARGERLTRDVRDHGITIWGASPLSIIRPSAGHPRKKSA